MLILVLAVACNLEGHPLDVATSGDSDGDGVVVPEDCDDRDAQVHPDALEVCDGKDDDCDGEIDEDAIDALVYYYDDDADGYGNPTTSVLACSPRNGQVADDTDCDDNDDAVYPGAAELCDGRDDDCDGDVDEDAVDAAVYYDDEDGDGYGTTAAGACPGAGLAALSGDCDDRAPEVNPAGTETCDDGIDEDCDPTACRRSGAYSDPISKGTADAAWAGASGVYWRQWVAWGDVDGDGYDDALIGSSYASGTAVDVEWGAPATTSSYLPASTSLQIPDGVQRVVDAGDLDGDGYDDVIEAAGTHAWVYFGSATRPARPSLETVGVGWTGGDIEDVAYAGDVDGDGAGDWLAYDRHDDTVWLTYGSPTRAAGSSLSDAASGGLVAPGQADPGQGALAGGDVDGDGLADLFACGTATAGTRRTLSLMYGDPSRRTGLWTVADADARLAVVAAVGAYTSCDPTDLGDVDADGFDDLGVGAGAEAWIWPGASTRLSGDYDAISASSHYRSPGSEDDARVTGGDLDADGFSDIAIALPWSTHDVTSVRLFYGSTAPWGEFDLHADADASILGKSGYGVAVSLDLAGDTDADGRADLLAVGETDGAWLFLGSGD